MNRGLRSTLAAILVLAAFLGASEGVRANGGTLRVARATVGPYLVSVWTQPDPPRVGRLDVSVAVMRPEDGTAILDAVPSVTAQLTGNQAPPVTERAVLGGGGTPLLYHAELELSRPGRWRVTVTIPPVSEPGGASFEIDAVRSGSLAPLVLGVVTAGLLALMLWRLARRARGTRSAGP
jgi:hypothetical protein